MSEPRVIERRMSAVHAADGAQLPTVLLRWERKNAAAVTVDLGGIPELRFELSRDHMIDGLEDYTGIGLIQVWPLKSAAKFNIAIEIEGFDWLHVHLPWSRVQQFLRATCLVVKRGDEEYDIDGLIAQLLEGAQP